MAVFCDRLKLGSKAALDCYAGQNKGEYCKKELLFLLLISLGPTNFFDMPAALRSSGFR